MKMNNIVACVPVSNIEEAVAWYQAAFELGAPHSMPMEGIVEFNLGRFWLQLFESPETAGAEGITLVLGVDDARAEQQRLADLGFSVTEIETIDDPFSAISTRAPQQPVSADRKPATNILLLGSDSRISAGDPSQWEAGAQRTDAIMIVQVSGDRQEVSVVSIPRDTWVEVPGYGQAKINAAYSYGGPSLAIQTVEQLTVVHIDHFVIADFESFEALTDEIGGVVINLKTPQTLAGTQFPAGAQRLNGAQALAYTRERKSLPGGDFDRINRQQSWMRAIVSQVLHGGVLTDPTKLYGFLSAVTQTMAVDEGFTIDEMQSLAIDLRGLRSRNINFLTIPTAGTGTSDDGQSIVVRDETADTPFYQALAADTVQEYLEAHPDAVPRLPGTAN